MEKVNFSFSVVKAVKASTPKTVSPTDTLYTVKVSELNRELRAERVGKAYVKVAGIGFPVEIVKTDFRELASAYARQNADSDISLYVKADKTAFIGELAEDYFKQA